MQKTTTMYDYLKTELINHRISEIKDKNQLLFFQPEFTFIRKMERLDDEVYQIVNENLFNSFMLDNKNHDREFKTVFFNKFLDREIAHQTIEAFSAQVTRCFLEQKAFLTVYYEQAENFGKGATITDQTTKSTNIHDNRYLMSTLPQNEINLNVDDTVLNYGDENTISRDKSVNENENKGTNYNLNPENLKALRYLLADTLDYFDKKCFLQIW